MQILHIPNISIQKHKIFPKNQKIENYFNFFVSKNFNEKLAAELADHFQNRKLSELKSDMQFAKMLRIFEKEVLIKNIEEKKNCYVFMVCGTNGVGKSTSIGKLIYYLLKYKFSILVAACDTFRSGAIEQLKRHVDELKVSGRVELYQMGYGKDEVAVGRSAIEWGRKHDFDIVIIDTSGRMANNNNLMSSLGRFAKLDIDHVIFVCEALVGNDSLYQLNRFKEVLMMRGGVDSLFLTKVDSVGDKIGTLYNLAVEVPILFLGNGQRRVDCFDDTKEVVKRLTG